MVGMHRYQYWAHVLVLVLVKMPDTKRRYNTACDKCHIQTKKHTTELQAAELSY